MNAEPDFLLARQPIYDRKLDVHGYELLSRPIAGTPGHVSSGLSRLDQETWESLTGGHKAYIRTPLVDEDILGALRTIGRSNVIPELDCAHDPATLPTAHMLTTEGFGLALNNFRGTPDEAPILRLASVVKIDIRKTPPSRLETLVNMIREGSQCLLLASKVDTHEQKELCLVLGFDLLEGYFLSQPAPGGRLAVSSRMAVLQLLSSLQNPDATLEELENIISRDAGLSYHLLRIANSAIYHLPRKIESLGQAIAMLGLRLIRSWATMIALARVDDRPNELMVTALVRARMCELLAGLGKVGEPGQMFTVGLFSILDALLDRPMEEILVGLPLAPEITSALLEKSGTSGQLLSCVLAWENGDWEALDWDFIEGFGISEDRISRTYLDAVRWANDCRHQLSSAAH